MSIFNRNLSNPSEEQMSNTPETDFYKQLSELLRAPVDSPSEKLNEQKEGSELLKGCIKSILERMHKLDLFEDDFSLANFMENFVDVPLDRFIEQQQKPWLSNKVTIGLMGGFGAGKTTVLNKLFNENFPVSRHESTALPSYLVKGSNQNIYTLVDQCGNIQKITAKQADIFNFSSSNSFPFARIFDYIVKENPDTVLDNISIIDTPGLFSTKTGHSLPTLTVATHCDIIFWVIPAGNGELPPDQIQVLKQIGTNKKLYLLFTFVDIAGHDANAATSKILSTAKDNGIEISGSLMFGKKDRFADKFISDFKQLYNDELKSFEKYNPLSQIVILLKSLQDRITVLKTGLSQKISEVNSEKDNIFTQYNTATDTFITAHKQMLSRVSNMIDTFNRRCSDATFCGGASGALCSDINQIVDKIGRMADAFNNIDAKKMVQYGSYLAIIARMEERQNELEAIGDDIKQVLKSFE